MNKFIIKFPSSPADTRGVKWSKRTASAVLERRAYMKRTFKPIREASFGSSEEFPAATHLDLMGSSSSARSTTPWWRPFFFDNRQSLMIAK